MTLAPRYRGAYVCVRFGLAIASGRESVRCPLVNLPLG